ncbi:asparagine synthase-related protein [Halomonas maura]|uniref:asparagine synthase-related protein n=1 Tax=Halomonas maura TaxID=117606 RepID=UPI0025B35BE4|nr:asparagine synthase-related protein [Halomonas maura]MDN3554782.1 asparagine synthase-related protein [Halomonas maura]
MSAILGRIHFSARPVDPAAFGAALATLDHYGREGASMRVEAGVGLGYQRLDVSPSSVHECQPLGDGHFAIVADAILDNRDSLCDELHIESHRRSLIPDSRLLLLAYRRWGRECVQRLVGDFAFALWDAREQVLFCARDHIGARPFYYHAYGECLVFSTDIRALASFSDLSLVIDETRVAEYLLWPLGCREASFFQGVYPLPAGHCMCVDRHGVRLWAYWQPADVPSIRYARREDYIGHLRELLEQAVSDRLCSSYPVGSHLSGGLDSAGVTILASRLTRARGERLDMSYSWSPSINSDYPLIAHNRDERRVIDEICHREGIHCLYGTTTGQDYLDYLRRDIALEGTTDLFEEHGVMRQAAQRGTRVMLSGWGGDESATFGVRGYPGYLLKRGRLVRLLSIAHKAVGGYHRPRKLAGFLWRECLLTLLPDCVYARYSPYLRPDQLQFLYRPDFVERFASFSSYRSPAWREYPDPVAMQALLLMNGHLASRMSTWAHWSARHGIVYRYPLTDLRLLRFTLGLPPDLLWYRGQARSLYRRALAGLLPREVSKNDTVNERKRMKVRAECWTLLAEEAAKGAFQGECRWLDMPAFHTRILEAPPEMSSNQQMLRFLPLCSAVQVWHLWKHYFLKS